jgi:predicted nucleic acid-binding protein
MIFADTNILVYALDPREPLKQAVASRLLREAAAAGNLVISTQVLQEFYAVMLRRRFLSPADAADALQSWAEHEVVSTTPALVMRAAELHQQHGFEFWEAMVVQAALEAGCSLLYTEDMQHGRKIAGLQIVNPFLHEVHDEQAAYLHASTAESVDQAVRRAIEQKRLIAFHYEGRPKEGEPHDYGVIGGNRRLNFFQTRGRSRNGVEEVGKWKTLDPAKMSQVRALKETFPGTRAAGHGMHKKWDEVIASVTLEPTPRRR